jgi:hypothetical protein
MAFGEQEDKIKSRTQTDACIERGVASVEMYKPPTFSSIFGAERVQIEKDRDQNVPGKTKENHCIAKEIKYLVDDRLRLHD